MQLYSISLSPHDSYLILSAGLAMARKILCVAEKPAIARAVATHMSGGSFQTVSGSQISRMSKQLTSENSMQSAEISM